MIPILIEICTSWYKSVVFQLFTRAWDQGLVICMLGWKLSSVKGSTWRDNPLVQVYVGGGLLSTSQWSVTVSPRSPDVVWGWAMIRGPSRKWKFDAANNSWESLTSYLNSLCLLRFSNLISHFTLDNGIVIALRNVGNQEKITLESISSLSVHVPAVF